MLQRTFLMVAAVLTTTAAHGIEFGWQTLPEGGIEYLVQVEPALLESFREQGFSSDVPQGGPEIRRIRIVVGEEQLPNQGTLPSPEASTEEAASPAAGDDSSANATPPDSTASETPAVLEPNAAKPIQQAGGVFGGLYDPDSEPRANPAGEPAARGPEASPTDDATDADDVTRPPKIDDNDLAASPPSDDPEERTSFKLSESGAKPWIPLMMALLGLFMSLGANVYLVWIHQSVRAKYRALLAGG